MSSPLVECQADPAKSARVFKDIKNPYYIGDEPGMTQASGWAGAWVSKPSVYAIAAETAGDVAAGVNFARRHNLRLVVKGGGHSYLGGSSAPDSLLIWTHKMKGVALDDAYIPKGCKGRMIAQHAVTVETGALWMHVYNEVSAKAGRYVQGGGCGTVGVAGLVLGGGFGSFSKNFGTAASSLIEAEVVTADGKIRTVNECQHPDLFWALKGGGGSTFGVVTKLTLKTHELPEFFGSSHALIKAANEEAFTNLIGQFLRFYRDELLNPHWGESISINSDNSIEIKMLFQGIDEKAAKATWQPFFDFVNAHSPDMKFEDGPSVRAFPAKLFWDPDDLRKYAPNAIVVDTRPGAPSDNILWAGDAEQSGAFLHGYESLWLPAALVRYDNLAHPLDIVNDQDKMASITSALVRASRHWAVELHFNKGLAGAPAWALSASKNTATNPAVLEAFCLAIIAGGAGPCYPGVSGHEPDMAAARKDAAAMHLSMKELRKLVPTPASYVSETNFFEEHWQESFWGPHYKRLQGIKSKYDPDGLFFVHHGVGSELWSEDGFTPR